jgi:acetyltransferase-like isoleucine patch superfamily enzyme
MKKLVIIYISILFFNFLHAQTGIGTTTPNASAKLDVYSTNKGFLPPRVTLTSVTDATTISSPAEGLLVYNLGSVGLQAGYYYWNGANWATIATATSAGNGVTASNMVNLYSKGYSNATPDSTIANATGYKFTVPVSGRYLFDFSSTGFSNATITYKVRQGTTDLGTDAQTSINNTVHVEYNGKIEVNLQAGVTYNVYVTTTGNRDAGDYDRVYYKLVAGNLPVTGQTVDYVSVSRTGSDQTVNTGSTVVFNTINGGNIPYNTSTGAFSLTAGKTYRISASISLSNGNSTVSECNVIWKTATGDLLTNKAEVLSSSHSTNAVGNGNVSIIYTPTVNTTVSLYVTYSTANALLWQTYTFASIEQIGSSAIVDPWILSGTNTYNTTGNVGIGTNAPTQALDVTGNVNVTGKINLTDPTGNVVSKAAAFVGRGVDVTLGNLKVRFAASGNMSMQLSTVSGTYSIYGSGMYVSGGNGYAYIDGGSPLSVSTTPVYLKNTINFLGAGNTDTWLIMDTSNSISWRISGIVGSGYTNNFISIERLL